MFDLKFTYLQEQNFNLARQLHSLRQILSAESQSNHRSLIYQLEQQIHQLSSELQNSNDALLLQKEARQIQHNQHDRVVEELNRSIFELNQQLTTLEAIIREEAPPQGNNIIQKLLRNKLQGQHFALGQSSEPVLFFQILEQLLHNLEQQQAPYSLPDQESFTTQQNLIQQSQPYRLQPQPDVSKLKEYQESEYFPEIEDNSELKIQRNSQLKKERSSLYFMKQNNRNLHLDLRKVKQLQTKSIKMQQKKEGRTVTLTTNVVLLKKSYIQLIGEHQLLKKRVRLFGRYIQELQERNHLLLKSRLSIRS